MKKLAVIACALALVACGADDLKKENKDKKQDKSVSDSRNNQTISTSGSILILGNLEVNNLTVSGDGNILCLKKANRLVVTGDANNIYIADLGYMKTTGDGNIVRAKLASYDDSGSGNKLLVYKGCRK